MAELAAPGITKIWGDFKNHLRSCQNGDEHPEKCLSATDPASQFRQQGLPINAEVAVGYFQSLVKNQERTIFDGPGDGDVCKNLEVYMFFVQDGLRPNSQLWMYNGLNNALIHSLFWLGKFNF